MNRSVAMASCAVLVAFVLSGCTGMRLYSDIRDKQGQAAKKAWSEVDLKGYFAAHREERKKLVSEELAASDATVLAEREATLRIIVENPVRAPLGLRQQIRSELFGRVGTPENEDDDKQVAAHLTAVNKDLADWQSKSNALEVNRSNQEDDRSLLAANRVDPFACKAFDKDGAVGVWKKANPQAPAKLLAYVDDLSTLCAEESDLLKATANINAKFRGALNGDWKKAVALRDNVVASKAMAQLQKAQYEAAQKEYDAAVAKGSVPDTPDDITKAAGKLRSAVEILRDAQNAFAKEVASKERLDLIDGLLGKIADGIDPAPNASKNEVIVLLLPKIATDVKAVTKASKSTPKAALLIGRDIELARLKIAQMEVAYAEQRAELAQQIFISRLQEAMLLRGANIALSDTTVASIGTKAFHKAVDDLGSSDEDKTKKLELYNAAARFLDAVGRQRAQTKRLDVLQLEISHERAIAYSEANANLWSILIGNVVDQAADFAASGQKFEQYKDLVNALALIWIGSGVNK